jgi:tetratricopeptide (TPR) repeat protein
MMASEPTAPRPAGNPPGEEPNISIPPPAPPPAVALKPSRFLVGFDLFLAAGVVVFAFVIASFAVKNSDFWQHLATGRLIAHDGDTATLFGKDPFSYTGEGRIWVNHAWLFDVIIYLLYSALGGPGLVVAKALLVAGIAALLMTIRPAGQGLWFAVVLTGLALLAMAPRLLLQPTLASYFFLTLTLFLLLKRAGSKGLPLYIGITFALWANCDAWFVLGPATLALYLIGELIQPRTADAELNAERGTRNAELSESPAPQVPQSARRNLAFALGVGVVACMIHPMHVRVWALPAELGLWAGADVLARDWQYKAFFQDALRTLDFSGSRGGNPLNAIASVFLAVLSGLGLLLNLRLRWSHVLVWLAYLLLAGYLGRAIPFFAITAAATGAWNFGAIAGRLAERRVQPGTVRMLALLRGLGRAGTVLVGLVLFALAPPGWLHPQWREPHVSCPLNWTVEPDPALERAARTLEEWRQQGRLPAEARGLFLHSDLANYLAWFAPHERNFFDVRFGFHAPEAADFVALRQGLSPRDKDDPRPTTDEIAALLERHGITYAANSTADRPDNRTCFQTLLQGQPPMERSGRRLNWALWDIEGRVSIFGYQPQKTMSPGIDPALKFDPVARAFGRGVRRLEKPYAINPPPQRDFLYRYLNPPTLLPGELDEAASMIMDFQYRRQKLLEQEVLRLRAWAVGVRVLGGGGPSAVLEGIQFQANPRATPELRGVSMLALRAAREAIAADPDGPDAYAALADATQLAAMPADDLRELLELVSLQRALARSSPEVPARRSTPVMHEIALRVAGLHHDRGRFDLALEYLRLAARYLNESPPLFVMGRDEVAAQLQYLQDIRFERLTPEEAVAARSNAFENRAATVQIPNNETLTHLVRAALARQFGLYREALAELRKIDVSPDAPSSVAEKLATAVEIIDLNIITGQVEEAYQDVQDIEGKLSGFMSDPSAATAYLQLRQTLAFVSQSRFDPNQDHPLRKFRELRMLTSYLIGDLDEAGKAQAQMAQEVSATMRAGLSPGSSPPVHVERLPTDFYGAAQMVALPAEHAPFLTILRLNLIEELRRYQNLQRLEADLHTRRALFALEQGDIDVARVHLIAAVKPQPGLGASAGAA